MLHILFFIRKLMEGYRISKLDSRNSADVDMESVVVGGCTYRRYETHEWNLFDELGTFKILST